MRNDLFYQEAKLPVSYRAQLVDDVGSGYDSGHMAPAGDMPTPEAKAQSFSLANMIPQHPMLNQEAWNKIEHDTRKYLLRASGDVFVLTGPKFSARPETIGSGRVWVPEATWKLISTQTDGRSWGYWMGNDAGPHRLKPLNKREFVQATGLRLLEGLPFMH